MKETPPRYEVAQRLIRAVDAFGALLSRWADRLAPWHRRLGSASRDQRSEPADLGTAGPAPRQRWDAPPRLTDLPVLRLAEDHEPPEVEDVYEGDGEGASLVAAAWFWTKRIVWIAGLGAAAVFAALRWEAWLPKAARVGRVVVTEAVDSIGSREQRERQRRALQAATEQLPHLAPETVHLVLSGSPTGLLDPPEVFHFASDAADRGLSALTSGEAEELRALRRKLLDELSPAEREQVREYEGVRTRRATFSFEDRAALEVLARGARALPPEGRARLQGLFGKAIAAGLTRPPEVSRPAAPER